MKDLANKNNNYKLTALQVVGIDKKGNVLWQCKCNCGNYTIVSASKFYKIKSCGCMIGGDENLVGKKFDNMTVIARKGSNKKRSKLWICRCDCGREKIMRGASLHKNNMHSCGCRNRWQGYQEISGTLWQRIIRNAKSRQIEFNLTIEQAWDIFIKQRKKCILSNENIKLTRNCKNQTASLDRINSLLGYTKDNVQWVHKNINMMKNKMSDNEFIEWCEKVVAKHKQTK